MSKTVLVIDALDECSDELDQLLAVLVKLSSDFLSNKICMSLENNGTAVSSAGGKYIRYKVSELKSLKGYDEATRKEVSAYLKNNAEGTFLWVSLVYQQLAKITLSSNRTMETLRAFPPGLDFLYRRILAQIMSSPDRKLCKKILATVCILHHPFDLRALAMLLDKEELSLKDAVEECCGLLVLKNNVVYFVHQSAKAFLQKEAIREVMPSGSQHENKIVLSRLVATMSSTLRRNIYELDGLGASTPKDHNVASGPLAPARYSCLHWTEHFSKANAMDQEQQLLKSSHPTEPNALKNIVWDARRFLQYFREGIENSPLQTYQSALLFSPSRSVIGDSFRDRELHGVELIAGVGEAWTACLQSLEVGGNEVSPVAFSHDGKTLASAYEDKHVRVWKPTTGSWALTLRGHLDIVHCVAFSQDGTTIISGSADGALILWDTKDGKRKGARSTRSIGIVFVCLVTSGTQLIAGCRGGSVRFWDLEDDAYYHKIPEVDSYVLALSKDGEMLASPSATGEVRLWNTKTRKHEKTLAGHTGKIQTLAFSNNGNKLASASEDETIKIWNPSTGDCLITLKCRKVSSMVFSADGTQQLVSNSAAGRSIFWDITTGHSV
ncbi:Vegetative incompatibility protein HET-E-1 [Colletotrichum viniferum]|nr:Vegetative incompatibility protein HET-E-1 [Colletotrichum viniferum]